MSSSSSTVVSISEDTHYHSLRRRWRNVIRARLDSVSSGTAENPVHLPYYFDDIKIIPSNSASLGVVVVATCRPVSSSELRQFGITKEHLDLYLGNSVVFAKVAMKFSPDYTLDEGEKITRAFPDNSLEVEKQIYSQTVDYLAQHRHTPHVVDYFCTISANSPLGIDLGASNNELFQKRMIQVGNVTGRKVTTISAAVVEYAELTLGHYLEKALRVEYPSLTGFEQVPILAARDLWTVIYQVLFTFTTFQRIGLRHNDFHPGNVLIKALPMYVSTAYSRHSIGGKPNSALMLPSQYLAKIIDFDRAAIYSRTINRNIRLDWTDCINFGQCNGLNPKYDVTAFLVVVYDMVSQLAMYAEITSWIEKVIGTRRLARLMNYRPYGTQVPRTLVAGTTWVFHKASEKDRMRLKTPEEYLRRHPMFKHQQYVFDLDQVKSMVGVSNIFELPMSEVNELRLIHPSAKSTLLSAEFFQSASQYSAEFPDTTPAEVLTMTALKPLMEEAILRLGNGTFPTAPSYLVTYPRDGKPFMWLFSSWHNELKELKIYDWAKEAASLYVEYAKHKNKTFFPHHPLPYVCILLSAPMLYGLPPEAVRSLFSTPRHCSYLAYDIWKTFNNRLPTVIPTLNKIRYSAKSKVVTLQGQNPASTSTQ